jgi:CoA-dependent NAD(P)H sulfur oxidoreductase
MEKILVIGGNDAGLAAASRAKRVDPRLEITVVEKLPHIAYSTCGVPYFIADLVPAKKLISYSPEDFEKERQIKVETNVRIDAIVPGRKRAEGTRVDTGEKVSFPFDRLLLATGARHEYPDIPGMDLANVFSILNLQDGLSLKEALATASSIAVVGGGYVGLEMAECLHAAGKKVHLFESHPQVMPSIDRDMAEIVEYELRRFGVKVSVGARVVALVGEKGRVNGLKAAAGLGIVPAEVVLVDTGVAPNVNLAKDAGIKIGVTGGISVDSHMETSLPGVYAAGNCAEMYCAIRKRPIRSFVGTVAAKQGRVAGDNLAARRTKFFGGVSTSVLKVFDLAVARTGLNLEEAAEEGRAVVSARIEAFDRAAYYPTAQKIWVKLVVERESRKLLGAQVVGYGDASKRIDVAATAITAGMRIDELSQLDLAYSPPYGSLWDPLLVAAQATMKKL